MTTDKLPENSVTKILEEARDELRRIPNATEEEAGRIIYDIARKAYRAGYNDGYDDN